jgi:hypothetical protein
MIKRIIQADTIQWKEHAARVIHIFSDSQAGLKALINPRMISGQVFLKACLKLERWCREAGFHMVFYWILTHEDIDDNKKTNKLTKIVVVRGSMPNKTKQMIRLGAAAKRTVRERLKNEWVQAWKKKTSCLTRHLIQAPGPQVLQYWKGLRKATSSVLIHLRTGRIKLNQYPIYKNIRQDARCGCGLGNQNP